MCRGPGSPPPDDIHLQSYDPGERGGPHLQSCSIAATETHPGNPVLLPPSYEARQSGTSCFPPSRRPLPLCSCLLYSLTEGTPHPSKSLMESRLKEIALRVLLFLETLQDIFPIGRYPSFNSQLHKYSMLKCAMCSRWAGNKGHCCAPAVRPDTYGRAAQGRRFFLVLMGTYLRGGQMLYSLKRKQVLDNSLKTSFPILNCLVFVCNYQSDDYLLNEIVRKLFKCPSEFTKSQDDVFKLLVLFDRDSKIQREVFKNNRKPVNLICYASRVSRK